jgi:hypothetical protein
MRAGGWRGQGDVLLFSSALKNKNSITDMVLASQCNLVVTGIWNSVRTEGRTLGGQRMRHAPKENKMPGLSPALQNRAFPIILNEHTRTTTLAAVYKALVHQDFDRVFFA